MYGKVYWWHFMIVIIGVIPILVFDVYTGKPTGCDDAWRCALRGQSTQMNWIWAGLSVMFVTLVQGAVYGVILLRRRGRAP